MKKLLTLLFLFSVAASLMAQSGTSLVFVDQDGNVVADGTTISRTHVEESVFGDRYIGTGLFVKNTSDASVGMQVAYQIETMDNGEFQICFPVNCIRKSEAGSYTTESGTMAAGAQNDLQCEWITQAYGSCRATLRIEVLNAFGSKIADGPAITVLFTNADPAGIGSVQLSDAAPRQYYSLDGRLLDGPRKGVVIVRQANGTTIKQLIK